MLSMCTPARGLNSLKLKTGLAVRISIPEQRRRTGLHAGRPIVFRGSPARCFGEALTSLQRSAEPVPTRTTVTRSPNLSEWPCRRISESPWPRVSLNHYAVAPGHVDGRNSGNSPNHYAHRSLLQGARPGASLNHCAIPLAMAQKSRSARIEPFSQAATVNSVGWRGPGRPGDAGPDQRSDRRAAKP